MSLSPSSPTPETAKHKRRHDPGAFGAWGLIGGALLGLLLGAFFGHKLAIAFTLGTVGWIAGMLKDRSQL